MIVLKKVVSGLTSLFAPPPPDAPVKDWDLNPYIHPLELSHGYAGHVVDLKGNDYVDLLSAWGANILGYGYPRVFDAIAKQASEFAGVGLPYPEFIELGNLLCDVIPCAEVVRYGKNGSDATLGAVRLARAVTGRERILFWGYSGFHDWYMASTDCRGIPQCLRGLIEPIPELTPKAVEKSISKSPGETACVIVDPSATPVPDGDLMREILECVHHYGALFIVDEVATGFRLAPGGMSEIWGIVPDLACFGKSLANGMPLSVLCGKTQYMQQLPEINYGMTFEGEAVSIAAAKATVLEIVEKNVCQTLAEKGQKLKEAFRRIAQSHHIRADLVGYDSRLELYIENQLGLSGRHLGWLFVQELVKERVMTLGTFILCYSHTDDDLRYVITAFEKCMKTIQKAIEQKSVEGLLDSNVLRGLGQE